MRLREIDFRHKTHFLEMVLYKSQNEDLGKIAEETLAGFSRFSLFLSVIEDFGTGWIGKDIPNPLADMIK